MLRFNDAKIKVGDTVPVVVDGGIKALEVVDMVRQPFLRGLFRRHPKSLIVRLPDGQNLNCRFFPISH